MTNAKELQAYEQNLREFEKDLTDAKKALDQRENQISQYASQSYGSQGKQNLIEWELDFKPELEDIGHSLRCDVIIIDKEGNQYWSTNPNQERIILNEIGVNDVLRKVIILVNKNKVLSNYTIEEISKRVQMIGHEIRALIYNNYEAYGIDNEYKMNNFGSMVLDILDIVESAYRRALAGETHKGLNEQRIVSQSEPLGNSNQQVRPYQSNQVKWYNPNTWGQ
jgi:hypothetical protein